MSKLVLASSVLKPWVSCWLLVVSVVVPLAKFVAPVVTAPMPLVRLGRTVFSWVRLVLSLLAAVPAD